MSEEVTTEEQSDKEINVANLRKEKEALEAQVQELSAFKVNETVRSVGLDPNEGNGAALKALLGSDASEEKAQELVAKFGWQADEQPSEKHEKTPTERVVQAGADKIAELNSVTTSDEPPTDEQRIAELEQEGKHADARALKIQALSKTLGQG